MELDKDRLAKLLNLTASAHDAEALAAIRKANELLRLSRTNWSAALGIAPSDGEMTRPEAQRSDRPPFMADPPRSAPDSPLAGHLRAYAYRDAFRREPLLARLLGFPFWIVVEVLALLAPDRLLDIRGRSLTVTFTLSVMLGLLAWAALGYALLVGFDFD
jgi:hypothetical protein